MIERKRQAGLSVVDAEIKEALRLFKKTGSILKLSESKDS